MKKLILGLLVFVSASAVAAPHATVLCDFVIYENGIMDEDAKVTKLVSIPNGSDSRKKVEFKFTSRNKRYEFNVYVATESTISRFYRKGRTTASNAISIYDTKKDVTTTGSSAFLELGNYTPLHVQQFDGIEGNPGLYNGNGYSAKCYVVEKD
jgi:hypothetical protein